MKVYILMVLMDVYSGSSLQTQEFNSKATCEAAKNLLYAERSRVGIELLSAVCVEK